MKKFLKLNQQLNHFIIYFVQMIIQENLKMILMLEHINLMKIVIIGLLKILDGVFIQLDLKQILIIIYLLLMINQII